MGFFDFIPNAFHFLEEEGEEILTQTGSALVEAADTLLDPEVLGVISDISGKIAEEATLIALAQPEFAEFLLPIAGVAEGVSLVSDIGGKVAKVKNVVKDVVKGLTEAQETKIVDEVVKRNLLPLKSTIELLQKQLQTQGSFSESIFRDLQKEIEPLGKQILGLQKEEQQQFKQLKDIQIFEEKEGRELTDIEQQLRRLQQGQQTELIKQQGFEVKLEQKFEREEEKLVGVIDDLAERLEESFTKEFDFASMLDLMNRLEGDDIVDFLSRNISDFDKMNKANQEIILDLAITKGV